MSHLFGSWKIDLTIRCKNDNIVLIYLRFRYIITIEHPRKFAKLNFLISIFDDYLHAYSHARQNIINLISINLRLRSIPLLLQDRQKNIIYLFQTPTKNPFLHMCTEEEVFSHLVLLVYKVYLGKHAIATSFYASNLKGFGSNGIQKEFTQCMEKQHLNKKFIKRGDNIKRYLLTNRLRYNE